MRIKNIFSVFLGVCFLTLLVNISIPSLHEKIHGPERAGFFGANDGQNHKSPHDADHSATCHLCQVVHYFSADAPPLASDFIPDLQPQNCRALPDNLTDFLIVLRTARPRAPPSSLS